jgi:CheY-like chemotaxis protein
MSARILIVEDERITAEDLRETLTDLGYTVTASVSNGADAIAQAEEDTPDLALMDVRIQGNMDGTETARVLRERFNIPVIYLTAHADSFTVARAKDAEPLGYITKPFQEAALHASIEIALHKHGEELKSRGKEELLVSTLRAIAEGVISADATETITLFNPAAEAWTGRPASEALGRPVSDVFQVVSAATGELLALPWALVFSGGRLRELPGNAVLVSRTGEKRAISGSIAPIHDHHGAVSGAVLVFGRAPEQAEGHAEEERAADPGESLDSALDDQGIGLGGFKVVAASPVMKQVLKFARRITRSDRRIGAHAGSPQLRAPRGCQRSHHHSARRRERHR